MIEKSGHIYGIKCHANGKIYIGSSVRVEKRIYLHKRDLSLNSHHSPKLQNAWNKYGSNAFSFEILEYVEDSLFLVAREQFWIWRNESILMNCSMVAGSPLGVKRTDEQKARMSAAKKIFFATEKGKAQLSAMHEKLRGREVSAEERAMRSRALTGKKMGREWTYDQRLAHSKALTGRKMPAMSQETKKKISEANKGKKISQEGIAKAVASRTAFIVKELPLWLELAGSGKSIREIEKITGRCRDIISRELKKHAK